MIPPRRPRLLVRPRVPTASGPIGLGPRPQVPTAGPRLPALDRNVSRPPGGDYQNKVKKNPWRQTTVDVKRKPKAYRRPLPIDPLYSEQIDLINRGLSTTEADLTYRRQQTSQDYGLDDPSNPFSRAALLQRHFDQSRQATTNAMAARGQLYAGATSNAQAQNTYGFQQGYDALQRGYRGELYDITSRRAAARQSAQEARSQAFGERVARALSVRPDTRLNPKADKKEWLKQQKALQKKHKKHHKPKGHKPKQSAHTGGVGHPRTGYLPQKKRPKHKPSKHPGRPYIA